jgi:hypothetical protein
MGLLLRMYYKYAKLSWYKRTFVGLCQDPLRGGTNRFVPCSDIFSVLNTGQSLEIRL